MDEKKIEKIQSYFRRNFVQNEMLKARDSYEEIFNEIEGDDSDVYVKWPDNDNHLSVLSYPKFASKKQKENDLKLVKFNQVKHENKLENAFIKNSIEFQKGGENLTDIDLNTEQIKFLDIDNLKKMSKPDLINLRESISLEMLWIQQAIQSRIQYLKLKKSLQSQRNFTSKEFKENNS